MRIDQLPIPMQVVDQIHHLGRCQAHRVKMFQRIAAHGRASLQMMSVMLFTVGLRARVMDIRMRNAYHYREHFL